MSIAAKKDRPPANASDEGMISWIASAVQGELLGVLHDSNPPPEVLEHLSVGVDCVLNRQALEAEAGVGAESGTKTKKKNKKKNSQQQPPPARKIKASHILVDAEDYCLDVKAMAEKGEESFASLARRHSKCGSGLATGGSLGEITRGQVCTGMGT